MFFDFFIWKFFVQVGITYDLDLFVIADYNEVVYEPIIGLLKTSACVEDRDVSVLNFIIGPFSIGVGYAG